MHKDFAENNDMTYGILRYANVYGPRQKAEGEGGVVAVFMNRMVGKKIVIYMVMENRQEISYMSKILHQQM
jgi:UDP-glucose 4-epimerase